jgi:succinate dehydrogenase/fumarate reductase flavoprotein subunit
VSTEFDLHTDFLVVGSGAAGMTAALTARAASLDTLVVEKTEVIGGSTAISGGLMWLPNNPLMARDGVADSVESALKYMQACIGDVGPASSTERRRAFVEGGSEAVEFLSGQGLEFVRAEDYPDYYPHLPGGRIGRAIECTVVDGRTLGPWLERLRRRTTRAVPLQSRDVAKFVLAARTWAGFRRFVRVVVGRKYLNRLRGVVPMGAGAAMTTQLLRACAAQGVQFWTDAPMQELIRADDRVVGAVVEHDGRQLRIGATAGVLLAAGGFARNAEMRRKYQPAPVGADWTSASPGDTGDAIRVGLDNGAAVDLMDDAWWGASSVLPTGVAMFHIWERSLPHSIMVDGTGARYLNESESYTDVGHEMLKRNAETPAIPSWLIMDARHRNRYPLGPIYPRRKATELVEAGYLKRAKDLDELAAAIDVDPGVLRATVERFNSFARDGVDHDFNRGASAYDRYYGDPRTKPNPCLGTIEVAPFYAVAMYPGDLGTNGGLLTDEHARVLDTDGRPIAGLYAAGNSSATVMGRTYPGPGSTIAPAVAFGYLAARHAATDRTGAAAKV